MQPFLGLTSNIKILSGALAVLALALFIPFATNLVQQQTSTTSQANLQTATAQTAVILRQHTFNCSIADPSNGIPANPNCNDLLVNGIFAVDVLIHSDIDASNLVNIQLAYPADQLAVEKLVTQGSRPSASPTNNQPKVAGEFFITSWVNQNYRNDQGAVQLVGAVPTPGFITTQDNPATMARIYFKALKKGRATISINDRSFIYRNADNADILRNKENLTLQIN